MSTVLEITRALCSFRVLREIGVLCVRRWGCTHPAANRARIHPSGCQQNQLPLFMVLRSTLHALHEEAVDHTRSTSVTGAAIAARIRREGYDWRALVRGLRVPTIVIHGEADLLPVSLAAETAGTIEGARLLLIPGAGHMPFWEAPEHFFGAADAFPSE